MFNVLFFFRVLSCLFFFPPLSCLLRLSYPLSFVFDLIINKGSLYTYIYVYVYVYNQLSAYFFHCYTNFLISIVIETKQLNFKFWCCAMLNNV